MVPFITPEIINLAAGAVGGFAMKIFSLSMQNRQEQFKMFVETIKARDESADKAALREQHDAGKWIRRFIVVSILFGVILAPFILSLLGKPIIVQIEEPVKEHIFGLWSTGGKTLFYQLNSYLLVPEIRQALMAIIGFYFGSSAAKK